MIGRLSSIIAKYKRMNIKPSHGPIHFTAPGKILWRTIHGMIPHKTKCGAAALARFKAYEEVLLVGKTASEVGWTLAGTIKVRFLCCTVLNCTNICLSLKLSFTFEHSLGSVLK
ncbi:hypothetical protein MKX03_030215 [Papaver bracteatum]|nr:hypothetical protein MKX03_030215 [Papaver bracteatum]